MLSSISSSVKTEAGPTRRQLRIEQAHATTSHHRTSEARGDGEGGGET
jgi:hypothetical protein